MQKGASETLMNKGLMSRGASTQRGLCKRASEALMNRMTYNNKKIYRQKSFLTIYDIRSEKGRCEKLKTDKSKTLKPISNSL